MKKLLILFILAIFAGTGTAMAQKIGYVDSQKVLDGFTKYKAAQDTLKLAQAEYEKQMKRMETKLQAMKQEYDTEVNAGTLKGDLQMFRMQEVEDYYMKMQQFAQYADGELMKKQEEIFAPIKKEIDGAIAKVAKEQNVNYVFEKADMLFVDGGIDLTSAVRVALGMNP